jgi:hypothetical protein
MSRIVNTLGFHVYKIYKNLIFIFRNIKTSKEIFPAATDSRFLREVIF